MNKQPQDFSSDQEMMFTGMTQNCAPIRTVLRADSMISSLSPPVRLAPTAANKDP
jgi:hypothetical protein